MGAREVARGLNRQHARFTKRTVGAEGLPVLVAIGASAGAAGDSHLVQVSGDPQRRRGIHVTETTETVAAASRHAVQKPAELVTPHSPRDREIKWNFLGAIGSRQVRVYWADTPFIGQRRVVGQSLAEARSTAVPRPWRSNRVGYFSPRGLASLSRWRSLRSARRSFTS